MLLRRDVLTLLGAGMTVLGAGLLSHLMPQSKTINLIGANKIPNVPLITHKGQRVNFYDDLVKDHLLVINMMYTSCSGICPLSTSNLHRVNDILTTQIGLPFLMCSMTLTPETDDPSALADYASKHHLPPNWLFLTGKPADVKLVRTALGFYDIDPSVDEDNATHTGMVRLGNELLGRWSMMASQASPQQIVDAIKHLARFA
ncbi:SCO family protein [Shewanella sp. A25]|nr:SCO family protein [Shewanella shenzhenensis]